MSAWAEQAEYWEAQTPQESPERLAFNTPRSEQPPVVLTGHGAQLRIHQGALVIRSGFSHHPQKVDEQRFFPADRRLPSRIIAVDCDGSISLDVLTWLSRHNVPLVQLSWQGEVLSVISNQQIPYDPALRGVQLIACTNGVLTIPNIGSPSFVMMESGAVQGGIPLPEPRHACLPSLPPPRGIPHHERYSG